MSNNINQGDLVQVVHPHPCCGSTVALGSVFIAGAIPEKELGGGSLCSICFANFTITESEFVYYQGEGCVWKSVLKKIDPPAEGDSLPTRTDMEVTA